MAWVGKWPGGRVWVDEAGRRTYFIRRTIAGRRFEVSTRASTLRGAVAQLERFEANPEGYAPTSGKGKLNLTSELVSAYLEWSQVEKRNSKEWLRRQRTYLRWWQEQLGDLDLRFATARDHLAPALDAAPSARAHRTAVMKGLYRWLRRERHLLTASQDASLDLASIQSAPAQKVKSKVISRTDEKKVLLALPSRWSDVARLLAAIGCHVTEAARFARDGEVAQRQGRWSVLLPQTKDGAPIRLAVSLDVAKVAQRVLAAGPFSESRFRRAVREAKRKARVRYYQPGSNRHTFATRQIEAGATPEATAAYLHHRSTVTTRRWYATLAVIPRPVRTQVRSVVSR